MSPTKEEKETTRIIREFLALSFEERKAMRPLLIAQLEPIMPNKRARVLYVSSLMCKNL